MSWRHSTNHYSKVVDQGSQSSGSWWIYVLYRRQLDLCGFLCILGNFVACCRISPLNYLGGKYCLCFLRWPAFKWSNNPWCKEEISCIRLAFMFKAHSVSALVTRGGKLSWFLWWWTATRIVTDLAPPKKHETITELTGNDSALSMKLHFKAESPLGFHCKLQNISIKLPFANKCDIILMTNWTTACLCTADSQLFSRDLLTALEVAAAGYIFFHLANAGTNQMKK